MKSHGDSNSQTRLTSDEFYDLVDQFVEIARDAPPEEWEVFLQAHPEHADQLREVLPALEALADLSESGASVPPEAIDINPNQFRQLGDFQILRELGRGGMGVVYEAWQTTLSRRVALKILPFAGALNARNRQRFQNEAMAAAQLRHPHIVGVHFVGCERGVHYYAMELIEGRTLADLLVELQGEVPQGSREQQLLITRHDIPNENHACETEAFAELSTEMPQPKIDYYRQVAEWGEQIAEALDYAHSVGVIHRDIKPSNILLDQAGHVWVTDFGLAQFGSGDAGLTMTGDILGTLRYMSPEQAEGDRVAIDHRTDLYSLGITIYELLTLRPAFPGDERGKLLQDVMKTELKPPRQIAPGIPRDLETIVLKAIAKDPPERYRTLNDFAADLRRFLQHEPIHARRPGLVDRLAKWSRRHRSIVLLSSTLSMVLAFTIAIAAVLLIRERDKRLAEQHIQQKSLLREQQKLVAAQGRSEKNYHLAKQAVGSLIDEVGQRQLLAYPELADFRNSLLTTADDFYSQLIEENPDDPHLHLARAEIRRALHRSADALDDYLKAEKGLPQSSNVKMAMAEFFRNNRDSRFVDPKRALAYAKQAVKLEPQNDVNWYVLAWVYFHHFPGQWPDGVQAMRRSAELTADPIQKSFRIANAYQFDGQIDKAIMGYTKTMQLSEKPGYHDLMFRARCFLRIKDNQRAIEDITQALEIRGFNAAAFALRGQAWMGLGDYESAVLDLERSMRMAPHGVNYLDGLVKCYLRLGKESELAKLLDSRAGSLLEGKKLIGPTLMKQVDETQNEELISARDQFMNRVFANLQSPKEQLEFAKMCATIHHFDEAFQLSQELIETEGEAASVEALSLHAETCYQLGDFRSAFEFFERALKLEPDNPMVRNRYAWQLATCPDESLRNPNRAVELVQTVTIGTQIGRFWNTYGTALYGSGHLSRAIDALERSMTFDKELTSYNTFVLAMAHLELGHLQQAKDYLLQGEKWMSLHDPNNKELISFREEARKLILSVENK